MNEDAWMNDDMVLRTVNLHKSYYRAAEVPVLRGVDLEVRRGELVSIIGTSGSGKSTLLHLISTLDSPDRGEIWWAGQRIDKQPRRARDRFRNEVVGFIFQFYHLLPELRAVENVMLPALIRMPFYKYWFHRSRLRREAEELLQQVGLGHRVTHKPSEMSGGEMQRAAIARALMTKPQLLLADEPTGNLDAETGEGIVDLLYQLSREIGLTVVMVTHDRIIAERADRVLRLNKGRLEETVAELPELIRA